MPGEILVFDMDGVLVDVSDSYRETIVRTVEHFTGREISRGTIQDYKNRGGWNNDWALSHQIIRDLGGAAGYDAVVDQFQRLFLGEAGNGLILRERWVAEPGLLERLSGRYQLAVFTGRLRAEAEFTLRRFAASLRFDPIVCHEDVTDGKPAPEGLLKIAAGAPGRKLWYVGDTPDDARAARAAGATFIGVASPSNPRRRELEEALRREMAVAVLGSINELESVL